MYVLATSAGFSYGVSHALFFQARDRCVWCCDARSIKGPTPGSTRRERCLPPRSAAWRVVPIGGCRLAPVWSSHDRQPNSFHTNAVPVLSRHHIPPRQGRSLHPYRGVKISALSQDHPLPDAARELSGVDSRLGLLLLEHILAVLVEVERLLPPPLLH